LKYCTQQHPASLHTKNSGFGGTWIGSQVGKEQKLSQRDIVGDQDRVTDLLMQMFEFDKDARISCEEALDHPYLEGY
jgi:hypothetical protein